LNFNEFPANRILRTAKKAGTPLYFYSAEIIRRRYRLLRTAIPADWDIYFAVKSNPNVSILKIYRELGAKAETASAGEVKGARKAGFGPSQIALSGPVKGEQELGALGKSNLFIVHAESRDELVRLNSNNRKRARQNIALRINPDFSIDAGRGEAMIGGREKFGFSAREAASLLKERESYKNLNFKGFHLYMGTQILSADRWLKTASSFLDLVAGLSQSAGFEPSYVDFGGGLGIPYREGEREFDLKRFGAGLKKMAQRFDKHNALRKAKYYIEPGRFLIGPAGVYVMRVLSIKKIRGERFALTDGGVHHALFPFRVVREHPVKLLNRKETGKKMKYILGGPLCTTLDQSELAVTLPELKAGDILGIFNAGSYGYTASLPLFLSHPLPAEVLGDGGSDILIRKPSADSHIFRDQVFREI
jgi:diaminopimelate decarboxylase